ncbi:MAG: class I SAM-dependent methyltransferase [Patescibacteria group bacterium]
MQTSPICHVCQADATTLWGTKDSYDLYRCQACDLIFVSPLPSQTTTLYNKSYFYGAKEGFGYVDYERDKEPMRSAFLKYLDEIEKIIPARGTMLDLGAATGFFLDLARQRGWKTQGVEISDYAASLARAKGISVATGIVEEQNIPANSLDVVTAWDVIEHVPNPNATLQYIQKILKPGGVLAINTPHGGSALSRILKTHWHLVVPPEHLYFFSPYTMKKILPSLGFEVMMHKKIGKKFTLPYILQMLGNWWKSPAIVKLADRTQASQLNKIAIPINLYDNFFLIARKKPEIS